MFHPCKTGDILITFNTIWSILSIVYIEGWPAIIKTHCISFSEFKFCLRKQCSNSYPVLHSTCSSAIYRSEINHIRHFIKIQFVNKGIEFINLPSIFKDKSVISYIPTYYENKKFPIICDKYNKPIRSTVFNYDKLVTEFDIENSIPDSLV